MPPRDQLTHEHRIFLISSLKILRLLRVSTVSASFQTREWGPGADHCVGRSC